MPEPRPPRVLDNASRLIDALMDNGPLTPAEIGEHIEIPRPTAYRLVEALLAIDFVRSLPDGRIGLSLRWLHLADATRGVLVGPKAQHVLAELAERTGQTTFLTVPRGDAAVCIDWAQGRGIELLLLRPGRELPLYAGAAGRVTLAGLGEPEREAYLARAPFPAYTPRTYTTAQQLRADVQTTREQGHCLSDEDVTPSIGALGVPVMDGRGRLAACLSLAGAARDILRRREEFVADLRELAPRVQEELRTH